MTGKTRTKGAVGGSKGGTALTLLHGRLEELRAALPEIADSVGVSWNLTFDKLQTLVGG